MSALSEASCLVKCSEAIRQHPNTKGLSLGPVKTWLSLLYRGRKDFRDVVLDKNGNGLADYACAQVEAMSKEKGKPWFRTGPKAEKTGDKDKKEEHGNGKKNGNSQIARIPKRPDPSHL